MPPKATEAVKGRPKGTTRGDANSEVRAMKWDHEADRELFIAILAAMPVKPDLDLVAALMRCSPRAVSERLDSLRKEARRTADPTAQARADATRSARKGPIITQYEPREEETGRSAGLKRNMAPGHPVTMGLTPSKRQKIAAPAAEADSSETEENEEDDE